MRSELDLRLLRAFVAVAEELHFTRAARRLYVAQQALSRDIRRLETQLGTRLLVRTTRHVALTADGERLLVHARGLLALNDVAVQDLSGGARPLLVDVIGEGLTAARIVESARAVTPQHEIAVRYGGGMSAALPQLLAGRLDVAFGRTNGLRLPFPPELSRRFVRWERLGLLLADDHPWATLDEVSVERLHGIELDASSGNEDAVEWVELTLALMTEFGARASAPHPHAIGAHETAHHLRTQGVPILTMAECPEVDGAVVRLLVNPVPVYPWAIVHRTDLRHPALATLHAVVARLGEDEGWTTPPDGAWISPADAWWPEAERV